MISPPEDPNDPAVIWGRINSHVDDLDDTAEELLADLTRLEELDHQTAERERERIGDLLRAWAGRLGVDDERPDYDRALVELGRSYERSGFGTGPLLQPYEPSQSTRDVVQALPVTIYLAGDAQAEQTEQIERAVRDLLETLGFDVAHTLPPISGSWIRKLLGRSEVRLSAAAVAERLAKLERALEIKTVDRPQSEVDEKQAEAVAKLAEATRDTEDAVIQIGSILYLKVDGRICAMSLSQQEIAYVRSNPRLHNDPRALQVALQRLADSPDDQLPGELGDGGRPGGTPALDR